MFKVRQAAVATVPQAAVQEDRVMAMVMDGGIYRTAEGRERCDLKKARGQRIYKERTETMRLRQGERCCICAQFLGAYDSTFDHQNGRGAGKRDDRIEVDGKRINGAAHYRCNMERGSKRTPYVIQ